jgi:hypothetical protein
LSFFSMIAMLVNALTRLESSDDDD